eukprot:snap_masked-scaffold_44-processed-gene-1.51-mRNA-1 protein AED:1.00 eAED:1.00 QI:0/0/0/0/1/1/2/0/65
MYHLNVTSLIYKIEKELYYFLAHSKTFRLDIPSTGIEETVSSDVIPDDQTNFNKKCISISKDLFN